MIRSLQHYLHGVVFGKDTGLHGREVFSSDTNIVHDSVVVPHRKPFTSLAYHSGLHMNTLSLCINVIFFISNQAIFSFAAQKNEDGRAIELSPGSGVSCLAFSPDHRLLVIAEDRAPHDLRLIDFERAEEVSRLEGHSDRILAVAFSPDGRQIATGGLDNTLRIWNVGTRRQIAMVEVSRVISLAFSPDSRALVSGHNAVQLFGLTLWNLTPDGRLSRVRVIETISNSGEITVPNRLRYAPDGRRVVFGMSSVNVLDVNRGTYRCLAPFDGHGPHIVDYLFVDDRNLLLAFDYSRGVTGWDLATGTKRIERWQDPRPDETVRLTSVARRKGTETILTASAFSEVAEWKLDDLDNPLRSAILIHPKGQNHSRNYILSEDGYALVMISAGSVELHEVDALFLNQMTNTPVD